MPTTLPVRTFAAGRRSPAIPLRLAAAILIVTGSLAFARLALVPRVPVMDGLRGAGCVLARTSYPCELLGP